MSYNEIEYTLRSLGVSNNTSPVQISPSPHPTQADVSHPSAAKQPPTTSTTTQRLQFRHKSPTERGITSLRNIQKHLQNRLSASSKSQKSVSISSKKRMIKKIDNDSQSISQNPQYRVCEHCQRDTNSQYYQVRSRDTTRIDDLQTKIKQLEKQIYERNYHSISFKNPSMEYFEPQNHNYSDLESQEKKFIHKCVEMVQKIANVRDPTLRFCWKQIKQSLQNPLNQQFSHKQFLSPNKDSKKSQIVIAELKSMLHVKHRPQINKRVASLLINEQIYERIYLKVNKMLNLQKESPSQLLHYLESKDKKGKN